MSEDPGATLGRVIRILPFSCVDGPGNRGVVFLAGCNFRCLACHNPHTIGVCDDCGLCASACPNGALTPRFQPALCRGCDRCSEACPKSSSPKSLLISSEDIMAQLEPALPFVSGLTVSGGEATLQPEFVATLLSLGKSRDLHTLVDSNGSAPRWVWDLLLPHADGVALDIKAVDQDLHRELTEVAPDATLDSGEYLARAGKLTEVRHLIIPGYTDSHAELADVAAWMIRKAPNVPLVLLTFRSHGVRGPLATLSSPSGALMEELTATARALGVGSVRHNWLAFDA